MTQVEIRTWNNRVKLHERIEDVVTSLSVQEEPVSYYQGIAVLFAASYIDPASDADAPYGYLTSSAA